MKETFEILALEKKSAHMRAFEKFQKTHPEVSFENFASKSRATMQSFLDVLNLIDLVSSEITTSKSFSYLNKILTSTEASLFATEMEIEGGVSNYVRRVNRHMISSIYSNNKTSKKIAVIAGAGHVTKRQNIDIDESVTKELYEALDKFKDENPYAILTCPTVR